ncbi:hypothetical protein, partial [Rhodococcus erythropolis]|uniref:hypothetical protein n=1 Tax=Rhodococcus erythropolis TaxID=1833 RepID=UPI001FD72A45
PAIVTDETFDRVARRLADYMWQLTFGWARRTHPKKPKKWIARRYWGRFNKFRNDQWVFGDPDRPLETVAKTSRVWSNSPGLLSSDTGWSWAGRLPTTRNWPATGPNGDARSNPHWTATTCACSPSRTAGARCAATIC